MLLIIAILLALIFVCAFPEAAGALIGVVIMLGLLAIVGGGIFFLFIALT